MKERQFRIREMRNRAGMKQSDVATALGVTVSRYGDWERETWDINLKDAIRLADLFGCTLDELANHAVPSQPSISADERKIIDGYRAVDEKAKRDIRRVVEWKLEDVEEEAAEKKEAI
jgi:transcriptional regulator with XRE-family HTH domain